MLQWRRNRDLAFEPFEDQTEADFWLRSRTSCASLRWALWALRWPTRTSYRPAARRTRSITFALEGSSLKPFKTKPKKKSLDPVWHEQFARSITPGKESMKLVCTCEDWDEVSGSDFMGQFSVDLDDLKDQKVLKKWFKLGERAEGDFARATMS